MADSRVPVSVVAVASNEEENLKRSLASVADWATEIVVLINDCTDNTEAVARSFGAQVYEEPWVNYTVQVQKAIDKATQPWILVLDADEEVPEKLKSAIADFVTKDDSSLNGAYFPRCTLILGRWIRHGDWYPDYVYRLFRKGKGSSEGAEHGRIDIEAPIAKLPAELYHYSFPDLKTEMAKIAHFANGFEKQNAHKSWSFAGCVFRAWWRFVRCYVLRLGFLDGFPGFYVAAYVSYMAFIRHSRIYKARFAKTAE